MSNQEPKQFNNSQKCQFAPNIHKLTNINSKKQSNSSQFTAKYLQFFADLPPNKQKIQKIFCNSCLGPDITFDCQSQFNKFSISIFCYTSNYEVISIQAKIGQFTINIMLLNINGKSHSHQLPSIESTFADLFLLNRSNIKTAIKCFQVTNNDYSIILNSVVKQYCFLKLASQFYIGPALSNIFGFDLIVYDDCIQFAMEKCTQISQLIASHELLLKQKMNLLHNFGIVHLDIKPKNIFFSPTFNEPVFIDFGLSQAIKQNVGEKTWTNFSGSLGYCSKQMLAIYRQESNFVDLYFNDVHCLQKSLLQIKSKLIIQTAELQEQQLNESVEHQNVKIFIFESDVEKVVQSYKMHQAKFHIYFRNLQIYEESFKRVFTKGATELLQFIKWLPFSIFLQNIYELLIEKSKSKNQSSTFNLQNKKQNHYFDHSHSIRINQQIQQNSSSFMHRFDHILTSQQNSTFEINEKQQIMQQSIRPFLSDIELVTKLSKYAYFLSLVKYIDLTNCKYTFQQKQMAVDLMLKNHSISEQNTLSKFQRFNESLTILFNYFITVKSSNIHSIVPIIFHNILIIEQIQVEKVIELFAKVINIEIDSVIHSKLLFRCYLGFDWIQNRLISKYAATKLTSIMLQMIIVKMQQLCSQSSKRDFHLMILKLIVMDRNIISFNVSFVNQILANENLFQKDFFTDIFTFCNSIFLKYNFNSSKPLSIFLNIQQINFIENISTSKRNRFEYYHFRIFNTFKHYSNLAILSNIYSKFINSLKNKELIDKFYIYYQFKEVQLFSTFSNNFNEKMFKQLTGELLHSNFMENVSFIKVVEYFLIRNVSNNQIVNQFLISTSKLFGNDFLLKIKFPMHSQYLKYHNFLELSYRLIIIYNQFNKHNSEALSNIIAFSQKLQSYCNQIICHQCKHSSSLYLLHIKAFILNLSQRIEELIQFLKREIQRKELSVIQKSQYYFKLLRTSFKYPKYQQKHQISNYFYNWMQKQQQYFQFLLHEQGQLIYKYITKYLLVQLKDYQKYIRLHYSLLCFIYRFPSKESIKMYFCYTDFILSQFNVEAEIFAQLVKKQCYKNIKSKFERQLQTMLFSIILKFQKLYDNNSTKLLKLICQSVGTLSFNSKLFVLGNLYYYLMKQQKQIKNGQNVSELFREKRMGKKGITIFRQFVKYCHCDFPYRHFANNLTENKKLKLNRMLTAFEQKIQIYFVNIKAKYT